MGGWVGRIVIRSSSWSLVGGNGNGEGKGWRGLEGWRHFGSCVVSLE